jgi:Na+-driven multidrug efflux pump
LEHPFVTALQALIVGTVAAALFVAAVFGLAGVWWAMMAAAVVLAAGTVLLYDPAKRKAQRPLRRDGFRVNQP